MSIFKQAGAVLAAFLFAGTAFAQAPDVKPERIRGDIVSFQPLVPKEPGPSSGLSRRVNEATASG